MSFQLPPKQKRPEASTFHPVPSNSLSFPRTIIIHSPPLPTLTLHPSTNDTSSHHLASNRPRILSLKITPRLALH
jgi:hypothetical protein